MTIISIKNACINVAFWVIIKFIIVNIFLISSNITCTYFFRDNWYKIQFSEALKNIYLKTTFTRVYPYRVPEWFETGQENPDTSCGTSVVSPQVSTVNEGDMTEVPQQVYG